VEKGLGKSIASCGKMVASSSAKMQRKYEFFSFNSELASSIIGEGWDVSNILLSQKM